MSTPNETHLRTANRLISAFGIQAAPSLIAAFIADDHPEAPALTGGDAELAEWNAKANDLALALEVANDHITALSAQVAQLQAALGETMEKLGEREGQIAALERDKEILKSEIAVDRECRNDEREQFQLRTTELERDRERLDWLVDSLEVDIEINGAIPLDHIDYEAWNIQDAEVCEATRTAWRDAIDSAMAGDK